MAAILNAAALSSLAITKGISRTLTNNNEQLSTGKRVNSALDDATDFYTSLSLEEKGSVYDTFVKEIKQSQTLISGASGALDSVIDGLKTAKSQLRQAISSENASARGTLAGDYGDQLGFVTKIAADNDYNGTNILAGDDYTTYFNEDRSSSQTIGGLDISTLKALGLEEVGLGVTSTTALTVGSAAATGTVVGKDTKLADLAASGNDLTGGIGELVVTRDGETISVFESTADSTLGELLSAIQASEEIDYEFDADSGELKLFGEANQDLSASTGILASANFTDITTSTGKSALETSDAAAERRITALDSRVNDLQSYAATLGSYNRNLNTRLEFSEQQASNNRLGSTRLVEADTETLAVESSFLQVSQQFAIAGISSTISQRQTALSLIAR